MGSRKTIAGGELYVFHRKNKFMEKWEYKIIEPKLKGGFIKKGLQTEEIEKMLNEMGKQEWELVNITPIALQIGWGSETSSVYFVFKRRVKN